MKLHLPKTLLAAVLACFTVGATGAYATTLNDATMSIESFTQENLKTLTDAGWALTGFDNNIQDGVFTSTSTAATIALGTSGSSLTTASSTRHIWSAIVTVRVDSLTNNVVELLNDAKLNNDANIGLAASSSSVTGTWLGGSNGSSLSHPFDNGNGTVTFGIVYEGDTGTTLYVCSNKVNSDGLKAGHEATHITLAGTAGIKYTNLYWFNNAVSSTDMQTMLKSFYAPRERLTWSGTASNSTWDADSENWSNGTGTPLVSFGTGSAPDVTFSDAADVSKTVNVSGGQKAFTMTVQGNYTFNLQEGASVTADSVRLDGSLRIDNNTGYTVSRWEGDGELILGWGNYRTNAASIANFSGNLRIAAGTGLRISDAGRTFSKVTVEEGASFCINNSNTVDDSHHHVGDIYISGDGLGTDDTIGALKLGNDRRMLGNVYIVGGSASISSWQTEHGYIDGDIIGGGGNTTKLKTLNAQSNGSGQLLDVVNITGVAKADLSSGTLNVTGNVTNNKDSETQAGGGFAKVGNGTLIINGNVTLDSSLSVQAGTLVIQGEGTVNVAQPSGDYAGQLELWNAGTLKIAGGRNIGTLTISGDGTLNGGTLNIAYGSIGLQQNLTFNKRSSAETIVLGDGTNTGTLNIANGNTITYASGLSVTATGDNSSVSGTGGNGLSVAAADQTFTNLTVGTSADTNVAATLDNSGLTITAGTATITTAQDTVSSLNVSSGATIGTEAAVTVMGNASISGTATLNANLTVEGSTTLATTDASIAIANGKIFSTDGGVLEVTGTANNTTITTSVADAEVTTSNEAITISNAAVTVDSDTDYTLGAKLSGSTLTNTGAGTATVKVEEGTTNSFDASSGSVTINTQAASVGDLTVGDGKTVTIGGGTGTATVSGTATLANGSTVGGDVTIADSGELVIGGTGFSADRLGAIVEGTLTANATAISMAEASKIDVTDITETTTYVLATAQNMTITGNFNAADFYTGTLAQGMTATVSVQQMQAATYAIDPATASQLVLTLTAAAPDAPVTLTATGVEHFSVEGIHNLRITVAGYDSSTLSQFAGRDLAVTIDGKVWQSIIDVMEEHGGIYNTAEIWLDWTALANQDFGTVSFNGYTGTDTPGVYQVSMMPEPTTATLSLLALAALAARRRRK